MAEEKVTQEDDKLEPEQKEEPIKIPEFPTQELYDLFNTGLDKSGDTGGLPFFVPGTSDGGFPFNFELVWFEAVGYPYPSLEDLNTMMTDAYDKTNIKICWGENPFSPSPPKEDGQGWNWEKTQALISLKTQQSAAVVWAMLMYLADWLKFGIDVLLAMLPKVYGTAVTIFDYATKTYKEIMAMFPDKEEEEEEEEGEGFWAWARGLLPDPIFPGEDDPEKEDVSLFKAIYNSYIKPVLDFGESLIKQVTDDLDIGAMMKMPDIPSWEEITDMFDDMFPDDGEENKFNWKDYIPDWKEYLPDWPTCEQITIVIPGIPPYSEMRKMKPDLPEECSYDSMKAFFFNDTDKDDQSWWDELKAKWPDSPWAKIKAFFGFGEEEEEDDGEPFDWKDYVPDALTWEQIKALMPDFPYTKEELKEMYDDFPSFADAKTWAADQFKALFWAIPEQTGDSSWSEILKSYGIPQPLTPWLIDRAEEFGIFMLDLLEALAMAIIRFMVEFVAEIIGAFAIPKVSVPAVVLEADFSQENTSSERITEQNEKNKQKEESGGEEGEEDSEDEDTIEVPPPAEAEEMEEPVALAA